MSPTEQATESAIAKIDEATTEQPSNEEQPKGEENAGLKDAPAQTKQAEEAPAEDNPKPAPDKTGPEEEPEDDGYVADEIEEALDTPEEPESSETRPEPTNFNPEQKYIYDNLPTLTVRGKTSADGQIKPFNVKVAQELPENFQFASDRDRAIFNQDIADQNFRAQQLQSKFQQDQQQQQLTEYEQKENTEINQDMSDLQREGLLPKFKVQPNDPKFADDPGVKQAQEVLNLMNERNQKYAKEGRLARLTYRDAYDIWASRNKTTTEQKKEDDARKEITRKVGGSSGASPQDVSKPRVSRGMTVDQILELHERDWA